MKWFLGQSARRFQSIVLSALCVAVADETPAGSFSYVEIVNHASNSIVAFDVAPAGSRHYRSALRNNAALPGGGGSGVIAVRSGDGCLRDLRVRFANGHVMTRDNFDLCALPSRKADHLDQRQQWAVRVGEDAIALGDLSGR